MFNITVKNDVTAADAEPCESVDASQDGGDDNESSTQLSVGGRSGPRIKNVCRRASIALGARAVFPPTDVLMSPPKLAQELTLSALSEAEKGRVVMERKTTAGKNMLFYANGEFGYVHK